MHALVSVARIVPTLCCLVATLLVACSSDEDEWQPTSSTSTTSTSGTGGSSSSSGSGGAVAPGDCLTKFDMLAAGAGSELHDQLCAAAGQDSGCDLCEANDYLGDYECDQAPSGDDSAAGSEAQPFATVQMAIDTAQPGDVIVLLGGTYTPTDRTLFNMSGTASAPIIIRSAPGQEVIIDGANVPEGNTESLSTPTWYFHDAAHWRIYGPIHLTNGRGAAVLMEEATQDVELHFIEASYNGQTASRGGHGFTIVEDEWADVADIHFVNCDAHHNANHLTRPGEDVAENLYQHGDGFRIKSGTNVRLTGCRAWNNLDDNYDLVWADDAVALCQCWSGFAGKDDAQGSMTGTPGFEAEWGEGIKLGYDSDPGRHSAVRCLSWKNVHLGFRMDGGPYFLDGCASFENGRRPLGWDLAPIATEIRNSLDLGTPNESPIPDEVNSTHNSWDADSTFTVAADDFVSTDDATLLGPRASDGSLPVVDFMRLADGSDLIDAGLEGTTAFGGTAPDIGCFERY
ncbi:MAG: DUF4990 domain-containing protein [Deltaproteobacteria bacterium]|nr:DUF4990 domain-containing protein [Deltaproteobacteria bacterium]